jgi:hypothetical protein
MWLPLRFTDSTGDIIKLSSSGIPNAVFHVSVDKWLGESSRARTLTSPPH